MAKKPTTTGKPTTEANAPSPEQTAPAPAQPWRAPANADSSGAATPAAVDAPAPVASDPTPGLVSPSDAVPSELHDQLTPAGGTDTPHEKAREEAGGNGGGTDVPSELIDQHTPSGPHPDEVDAQAEALTPDSSLNRVDAEAKDQVTPHGDDLSAELHELFEQLSEDERDEFNAEVSQFAEKTLRRIVDGRKAREMQANLVDGNDHYGARARRKQEG